jgi:hypothetical protein
MSKSLRHQLDEITDIVQTQGVYINNQPTDPSDISDLKICLGALNESAEKVHKIWEDMRGVANTQDDKVLKTTCTSLAKKIDCLIEAADQCLTNAEKQKHMLPSWERTSLRGRVPQDLLIALCPLPVFHLYERAIEANGRAVVPVPGPMDPDPKGALLP